MEDEGERKRPSFGNSSSRILELRDMDSGVIVD